MFGGCIFFYAIREVYGKSEQNDKIAWMTKQQLLFSFFVYPKTYQCLEQYASKFCMQNAMIIWDLSFKYFCRFLTFQYASRMRSLFVRPAISFLILI